MGVQRNHNLSNFIFKGLPFEKVAEQTTENARTLFNLAFS